LIFADSSFFIAFLIEKDQRHEAAVQLLEQLGDRRIVTTNHVRGETWTWLCSKARRSRAVDFLDSIGGERQRIEVARVSEEQEEGALAWLCRHDEREYSFVDATSFAYMRARRIEEALTFDGDFAAAGFTELRP
jgi:uncharacterized protein